MAQYKLTEQEARSLASEIAKNSNQLHRLTNKEDFGK